MDRDVKQNAGDFGAVILLVIAGMLCPPSDNLRYHVSRFFGMRVHPTKQIIEREIERAADAYGISRSVFKALVEIESGGNHLATSRVGARGVTQVMPFNSKRCGLSHADNLWDVVYNIRCGARILSEELDSHGNMHEALTVYNCGKVKCPQGKKYASKVLSLSKKYS